MCKGIMMIIPGLVSDIIGLVITIMIISLNMIKTKKEADYVIKAKEADPIIEA
ncbi:hypothetical protein ACFOU2_19265 [Bacillus songklensis]|uniref:Uncharacterized protein n=1 Tax=Bacillus songklensis TaxID=1069116 RepID=A0ABV8B5A8_9BACI